MPKALFPLCNIGHFINEPYSRTDFEILRFEEMEEPDVDEFHKHAFYEILWTEAGQSRQTIDYKEYDVLPGSLFFISPNQVHRFEEWKPLKGGTILFTEDFFLLGHTNKDRLFELSFLDNLYANPCVKLSQHDFASVKHTIDLICAEQARADSSHSILKSLLHVLLAQVQRAVDAHADNPADRKQLVTYKHFQQLLEIHFADNKPAGFYAAALAITPHHLNRIVKAITGKTATDAVRARSILEAKRLLTFSDETIAGIAAALAYFDGSYFSKIFKAAVGKTPQAFRAEMSDAYRIK